MSEPLVITLVLAWLAIVLVGWLGWQLLRQNGRMLLRVEELEKRLNELEFEGASEPDSLHVGSTAPEFGLPDLEGEHKSLAQYRGRTLLLVFLNPACGYCRDLSPRLREKTESKKQKAEIEAPFLLIFSTGGAETNRILFQEHKLACPVLIQKESEVATAYKANGTPSGCLISPEGKIASELTLGADVLLALAAATHPRRSILNPQPAAHGNGSGRETRFGNRSLARSKIKRDGLKASTPAPDFNLPRVDGRGDLTLSDLRGRRVLLVFSSPTCGPCLELAPQLEKFHRAHPELEIVMISKGEPKENRAKVKENGLTFSVVLQHQWEISRRYAMFATPIAYLIDEVGAIARDVAVGTDAILALLIQCDGAQALRQNRLPDHDDSYNLH